MTMGEIIRTARKQVGLTQAQLGELLGVSGAMIGQWENDLRNPKGETIQRIEQHLGQPFTDLVLAESDVFIMQTKQRLEAIRAENEAIAQEIGRKAEEAMQAQIATFVTSTTGRSIIDAFYRLNEFGQEEAMERIIELSFLPQFSKDEVPCGLEEYVDSYLRDRYSSKYHPAEQAETPTEPLAEDEQGKSSTEQEKPPAGQNSPIDGK